MSYHHVPTYNYYEMYTLNVCKFLVQCRRKLSKSEHFFIGTTRKECSVNKYQYNIINMPLCKNRKSKKLQE